MSCTRVVKENKSMGVWCWAFVIQLTLILISPSLPSVHASEM